MTEDDDSDSEGALFGVSTMNMSNNTNNTDVLFGFGSSPTVTKDFSTSGFNKNNILLLILLNLIVILIISMKI